MRTYYTIFISLVIFSSCCSPSLPELHKAKSDSGLRMKVQSLLEEKKGETLDVIIQCTGPITPAMRKQLGRSGVTLLTVIEDIATVSGTAQQISVLSNFDIVKHLEISQNRPFLQ